MSVLASDQLGREGEAFVRLCVEEMGCRFIPGDGNLPSIEGHIQIRDPGSGGYLYIAVQVKTGQSHLSRKRDPKYVYLSLDRTDVLNWKSANVPVIIVWVDGVRPSRTALWGNALRAKKSGRLRISSRATFDCTSVGDLLKLALAHAGRPQVPRLNESPICLANVRDVKKKAREYFRCWREAGSVSPVFGRVRITLKAWRHMTRASLSQRAIVHRLALLSCAKAAIETAVESQFLRKLENGTELRAVRGVFKEAFRSDVCVEVVIQAKRHGRNGFANATLYSVLERKSWFS